MHNLLHVLLDLVYCIVLNISVAALERNTGLEYLWGQSEQCSGLSVTQPSLRYSWVLGSPMVLIRLIDAVCHPLSRILETPGLPLPVLHGAIWHQRSKLGASRARHVLQPFEFTSTPRPPF